MGYRNYISKIPKNVYLEIKDLTEKELIEKYGEGDDENYFYYPHLNGYVEIYELGKYCDFDIEDKKKRLFTHEMSFESDMEFSLGSKELLETIIKSYHQKVINWYSKSVQEKTFEELKHDARIMLAEWKDLNPYDLNIENENITKSWKYEYSIFELVRIYKTFDWKNDVLIYCGG